MKYTAKDVSQIMDINRETLRYYEKSGLISPEIDEKNHYRYYDDWDFNYLGECKRYRALGFSIEEIREIFQRDNLSEFTEKMERKQEEYLKKLRFYESVSEQNERYIRKLKKIADHCNLCEVVKTPKRYFVPNRKNFDYKCAFEKQATLNKLMDSFAFIEATILITRKEFQKKSETFFWGFSITEEMAQNLQITTEGMQELPGCQAVYSIVDAGERWNFSYNLLGKIQKYIEENQFELMGDIYGNLLTRIKEEESLHRYIEIYCPVRRKTG